MANSSTIIAIKNNVINAMCNDGDIVSIIDSPHGYTGDELKGTHIFNYNKNPETIVETISFITVLTSMSMRDKNGTFVTPTLSIYIYTHNGHMDLPKEFLGKGDFTNRNDYLSFLIDEKFNGTTEYGGIGRLILRKNDEFVATSKFNGRHLLFETIDINDSTCDRW